MSQDIADGRTHALWFRPSLMSAGGPGSVDWLVSLGRIEDEFAEKPAGGGVDHPDVAVVDQDGDVGARAASWFEQLSSAQPRRPIGRMDERRAPRWRRGQLLLWLHTSGLYAVISDHCAGIPSQYRMIPAAPGSYGSDVHGLWLIGRICASFDIDTSSTGTGSL
jgi:hypothetical protein